MLVDDDPQVRGTGTHVVEQAARVVFAARRVDGPGVRKRTGRPPADG